MVIVVVDAKLPFPAKKKQKKTSLVKVVRKKTEGRKNVSGIERMRESVSLLQ